MGEVYRARDSRLGRAVAIKVLRREASLSAERRARFAREARAVSSLDHPHICKLFDVGEEKGVDFLVMQLVEGENLAERLDRGPLPIDEALERGIEIADALASAHQSQVIHRDLKPANIILGNSGAMVLDFGLAKMMESPPTGEGVATESPTEELETRRGTILGTSHYLTPEQLGGKQADTRSDIFALGALLYEMVTGHRAFTGENPTEVMTSILTSQPPASRSIESHAPLGLDHIIERCLAKDPEQRWQSARDICEELKWVRDHGSQQEEIGPPSRSSSSKWLWLVVGGLIGAALVISLEAWRGTTVAHSANRPARFVLELGDGEFLHEHNSASLAFSPNGGYVAYVANRGSERMIYLRAIDQLQSIPLAGTERARSPVFAPDGEWIAFETGGKLKKISIHGSSPEFLTNLAFFAGASWGAHETLVYTPSFMRGLFAISSTGGTPRTLTTPETNQAHLWPEMMPDGRSVLFTIWTGTAWDQSQIALLSLATGEWKVIVENGFFGRYAPTGHVMFLRSGTLFAVPFDPEREEVTGTASPVVEGVLFDPIDGAGQFAVSSEALVYASDARGKPTRSIVWVDRSGERTAVTESGRIYGSARVSPDGTRLAVSLEEETLSIWVYSLERDTLTRVSFGSDDHNVAWSPDGLRIAFESGRAGVHQVYVRSADGSGEAERITSGEYDHYLCDWSPDGRWLAYVEFHPVTGSDLWVLDLESGRARVYLDGRFYEKEATFSPDGRWVAYVSDESGRFEVYVQPFPGPGRKWQVSNGGGEEPAWSRSGRELFYRSGGRVMAVEVSDDPELETSRPVPLFEGLFHDANFPTRTYDVGPDGRFVMVAEPDPEFSTRRLEVVWNWSERLQPISD